MNIKRLNKRQQAPEPMTHCDLDYFLNDSFSLILWYGIKRVHRDKMSKIPIIGFLWWLARRLPCRLIISPNYLKVIHFRQMSTCYFKRTFYIGIAFQKSSGCLSLIHLVKCMIKYMLQFCILSWTRKTQRLRDQRPWSNWNYSNCESKERWNIKMNEKITKKKNLMRTSDATASSVIDFLWTVANWSSVSSSVAVKPMNNVHWTLAVKQLRRSEQMLIGFVNKKEKRKNKREKIRMVIYCIEDSTCKSNLEQNGQHFCLPKNNLSFVICAHGTDAKLFLILKNL